MISQRAFPLALAAAVLAGAAGAQTPAERVAVHTDWSVFTPSNPRECYIVSSPTASTARRGDETVQANRGEIHLFVTSRPSDNVTNEVSFTGGYPFADNSPVEVEVGSETFTLNSGTAEASEWAWPASPADDQALIDAFRRGATATVTATSQRGTTTVDTFSLSGFTAAIEDAQARCR